MRNPEQRYPVEMRSAFLIFALFSVLPLPGASFEYRLVSTRKTSTAQKELNSFAAQGFRLKACMGGETAFGGNELVCILGRDATEGKAIYEYRVLATNKTKTMEKELTDAGQSGFRYRAQTVYESSFGGKEVVVVLEKDMSESKPVFFKLVATSKTSTFEKELAAVGAEGFDVKGITVAQTAFGGSEVVAILESQPSQAPPQK